MPGALLRRNFHSSRSRLCDLVPVGLEQRLMHRPRDTCDSLEVPEHALVAVNVGFEDLPVVDARLPRRPGVGQNEA